MDFGRIYELIASGCLTPKQALEYMYPGKGRTMGKLQHDPVTGIITDGPPLEWKAALQAENTRLKQTIRLYELAKVDEKSASLYAKANGIELKLNGEPMTALKAIKARKPPEAWRPSVDDFDLLPDV